MNIFAFKIKDKIKYAFTEKPTKMAETINLLLTYYNNSERVNDLIKLGPLEKLGVPDSQNGGIDEQYAMIIRENSSYLTDNSVINIVLKNVHKFSFLYFQTGEKQEVLIDGYITIAMDIEEISSLLTTSCLKEEILINNIKRDFYSSLLSVYLQENPDFLVHLIQNGYDPQSISNALDLNEASKIETLLNSKFTNIFDHFQKIAAVKLSTNVYKPCEYIESSYSI